MEHQNPAYVTGGVYALESSATPELIMTYNFYKNSAYLLKTNLPETVEKFFSDHINEIDIKHESRLADGCVEYLTNKELRESFKKGFDKLYL